VLLRLDGVPVSGRQRTADEAKTHSWIQNGRRRLSGYIASATADTAGMEKKWLSQESDCH